MSRASKRFTPSKLATYIVPMLLLLLTLALGGTFLVIVLSVAGIIPGG